jgi:poly(3-hydroxybutyrate) depolymerase
VHSSFNCLFLNHSLPTNSNKITNCFKLFSILQLYNYICSMRSSILIFETGGCCPNETTKQVDDVKFMQQVIRAVTNYVTTTYDQTKPKHTFIVGVSNGGMLANRLTCELNFTSLRAFASISGPLVLKNDTRLAPIVCDRTKRGLPPVPLLHIHGLKDPIVPFGGCNSTYASFGKACIWLHAQNPDMVSF